MSRIVIIDKCSECPNYNENVDYEDPPFCELTHTDIPYGSDIPKDCPLEEKE